MKKFVYDADALAFITAAAITDNTQKLAIDTLVKDLKSNGIWAKCYAIYPFVGDTAFTHKFNLKDPRDLNAAFRLTFNGGVYHSSNGIQGNGVNGEANTWFDTQIAGFTNNNHITTYILSDIDESAVDMGFYTPTYQTGLHILSKTNNISYFFNYINSSYSTFSNTDARGFYINSRTSNSLSKVYKNELLKNTITGTTSLSFIQTYLRICARGNESYGVEDYSSKKIGFASIGTGLTDAQALNYYTAVQKFQTSLGRQFDVPTVSDADAQAFLNAANINDITQANAINTLVIDLKAAGLWTKMKAIYPFVGGTTFTHKWNLKDPRNLTAAYILNYVGGVTHDSNGINFNGTNSYAETNLNPTLHLTTPSHLSYYTRTNGNTNTDQIDLGISDFWLSLWYKAPGYNNMLARNQNTAVLLNGGVVTDSRGFGLVTKISNTAKLFKNGIQKDSKTDTVTTYNNATISIGAFSLNAVTKLFYTNRQSSFASIGAGLTDTEAANYYIAVQAFQTNLGRQV
jgi:hypothetical protein